MNSMRELLDKLRDLEHTVRTPNSQYSDFIAYSSALGYASPILVEAAEESYAALSGLCDLNTYRRDAGDGAIAMDIACRALAKMNALVSTSSMDAAVQLISNLNKGVIK